VKRTAIFQLNEIGDVTQLLFVEFSPDQLPLLFEQRINERPSGRKIKLLGIEGEINPESLPPLYIAFRAMTLEAAQSIALRGVSTDESSPTARFRILLVDVNDDVCSVVSSGLKQNNFDVIRARNMAEAEIMALGPRVDVLLLDIRSLGERALLGIHLLKATQPRAKTVLLSESDHGAVSSKLSVALEHSLVQKPFTLKVLLAALR
jgi:CheY-like chemotaxis protein